ncbi:MAG: magnesium transporter CorA family protein [bacterium]
MLRTYSIDDGRIAEAPGGDGCIMVFVAPDEGEKRRLTLEYKIDEHTLNSSLDPDELARLEFEPEHVALIYKRPRNYSGRDGGIAAFKVASSGIFLFKNKLIIVQPEDIPLFEGKHFGRRLALPHVMLGLIYRSIFHFLEHLKVINAISEELEQKINAAMENRYLINLFALEKSLVFYLNSINTNGVLLEKLRHNGTKIGFSAEELEFLDDIMVENSQCYRQAEIYSNILASLMDARASIVGNNLNVLMKTLNIITIGIMVPTFVVSAFSMNVGIPLKDHRFAFWIIMGLGLVSVFGFMLFWRYKVKGVAGKGL